MPWCLPCDRWFNTEHALVQHQTHSTRIHHMCFKCDKDFGSERSLIQHYVNSPQHAYCQRCDEHFDDFEELYEHYDDAHWYCDDCNSIFESERGLHEHRRQAHSERYCVKCMRMFQNANNLRQHQRSAIHQERNFLCPMKGCDRAFVSSAAVVLHLESGTCVSGFTRKEVDRYVAAKDKHHIITNPSRLIENTTTSTTWKATERAWNGRGYECYMCHHEYGSLAQLNEHLRSPAHGEILYRCPKSRHWHGCGAEFKTLSGFFQHLESERCGVHRFKKELDRYLDIKGRKRLTAA